MRIDFIAHFLWSGIIFAGNHIILGIICGILPDLIPFGLNLLISPLKNQENLLKNHDNTLIMEYYQRPQNLWIYKLYNWTHSLIIWGIFFGLLWVLTSQIPWYLLAWLLHILIDIPTHTKSFFAPQFLTPLSKFCIDGISWANKKFMIVNYSLITIFLILRISGILTVSLT